MRPIRCMTIAALILPLILAAASAAPAAPATRASPKAPAAKAREKARCRKAAEELDKLLDRQDDSCATDADCGGYYYRADSCRAAAILRKPGVPGALRKHLGDLQDEVLNACGKLWASRPACAPIPFQARCSRGRCVDARGTPASAPRRHP